MTLDEEVDHAFDFMNQARFHEVEPILARLADDPRVHANPALYADVLLRLGTCQEVFGRIGDAVTCWAAALRILDQFPSANASMRRAIENEIASYRDSPRAFISYSHADKRVVHRVTSLLQNSGCRITLDAQDFAAGPPVLASIERAMRAAPYYLIFWSANYNGRKWTTTELDLALDFLAANEKVEGADGRQVIIIRLDSEPLPSHVESLSLLYIERGRLSAPRLTAEILRALTRRRQPPLR
jgi:hypothetical protein